MPNDKGAMSAGRGPLGLPSTRLGRVSVAVFLAGVVLVALNATVLESASVSAGNLNIVGAITFLVLAAALATGAMALIRDRERSWAVWISTGLPALLLGFEIVSSLISGE